MVAIVATLASSVLWRQEIWIADLGMQRERLALRMLLRNGTDWARAVLAADARMSAIDHPGEPWATRVPPTQLEQGEVGGFLDDEQGKWNLNNLVRNGMADPRQLEASCNACWKILACRPAWPLRCATGSMPMATLIPPAVRRQYYLSLSVPYRAANAPLSHVDELRLVKGFSPEVIASLRPFVTALPEFAAVNVNTAPRELLAAVQDGEQATATWMRS